MADIFNGQSGRLLREDNWRAQSLAQELYAMFTADPHLTPSNPIEATLDDEEPLFIIRGDDNSTNPIIFRFVRPDQTTEDLTKDDLQNPQGGGDGGAASAAPVSPTRIGTVGTRSGSLYTVSTATGDFQAMRVEGDEDGFDVPSGSRVLLHTVLGGDKWFNFPYPQAMRGIIVSGGEGEYEVEVFPYSQAGSTIVTVAFPGEVGPPLAAGKNVTVFRSQGGEYWMTPAKQQVFAGTVVGGGGDTYEMDIGEDDPVEATQLQIDGADEVPAGSSEIVCLADDGTFFIQFGVFLE